MQLVPIFLITLIIFFLIKFKAFQRIIDRYVSFFTYFDDQKELQEQQWKHHHLLQNLKKAEFAELEKRKADEFSDQIKKIINEHKFNLLSERKKFVAKDAYGIENINKWIGKPLLNPSMIRLQFLGGNDKWFAKGIPYFWYKIILPQIGKTGRPADDVTVFFEKYNQYRSVYATVIDSTDSCKFERARSEEDWYLEIAGYIENECLSLIAVSEVGEINEMSGLDYEEFCEKVLRQSGWAVKRTSTTGDQGVDLIATIDDFRVCIQCKRYSKPVGNKAVQEVVAGMIHWNGTHSVVVSNAGFTDAAKKLADSASVILIGEAELPNLISRVR